MVLIVVVLTVETCRIHGRCDVSDRYGTSAAVVLTVKVLAVAVLGRNESSCCGLCTVEV